MENILFLPNEALYILLPIIFTLFFLALRKNEFFLEYSKDELRFVPPGYDEFSNGLGKMLNLLRIKGFDVTEEKTPTVEPKLTMGKKIKLLRAQNDMTVQKLADFLGISKNSVHCWEKGKTNPTHNNLIKIARLFSVSVGYLLDEGKSSNFLKDMLYHPGEEVDPALLDLINDDHLIDTMSITEEEIEICKSIKLGKKRKPTIKFYINFIIGLRGIE